jgi:hypothetical protein
MSRKRSRDDHRKGNRKIKPIGNPIGNPRGNPISEIRLGSLVTYDIDLDLCERAHEFVSDWSDEQSDVTNVLVQQHGDKMQIIYHYYSSNNTDQLRVKEIDKETFRLLTMANHHPQPCRIKRCEFWSSPSTLTCSLHRKTRVMTSLPIGSLLLRFDPLQAANYLWVTMKCNSEVIQLLKDEYEVPYYNYPYEPRMAQNTRLTRFLDSFFASYVGVGFLPFEKPSLVLGRDEFISFCSHFYQIAIKQFPKGISFLLYQHLCCYTHLCIIQDPVPCENKHQDKGKGWKLYESGTQGCAPSAFSAWFVECSMSEGLTRSTHLGMRVEKMLHEWLDESLPTQVVDIVLGLMTRIAFGECV